MKSLFWGIVAILNSICAKTGLSYAAINILIYTLLIPALWAAIVFWRKKQYGWLLLAHASLCIGYCAVHQSLSSISQDFYDSNIRALEWLGTTPFPIGYIGISVLVGVLLPITLFVVMCLIPIRYVLTAYVSSLTLNLFYYTCILTFFKD